MRHRGVLHSLRFLFVAPMIVGVLFVINLMKVLRALVLVGGLAGLVAILSRRQY